MTDLDLGEAVCFYCPYRFYCTLNPCMCADCQDYLDDISEDDISEDDNLEIE